MAIYIVIRAQIKGLIGVRGGKAALILSFIWIKNLSSKLNVILNLCCVDGTMLVT